MSSQKVLGVIDEVVDREELSVGYFLQALICHGTLFIKRHMLLREKEGVLE